MIIVGLVCRRILGSLISAHILLTDSKHPFGRVKFEDYDDQLLRLAYDLAVRLLPAFENTSTGIPYARVSSTHLKLSHSVALISHYFSFFLGGGMQVNLKSGVPSGSINETCTAGAGSLLVEFGVLSRLTGDSTFEAMARQAVRALWKLRNNETGLLGSVGGGGERPHTYFVVYLF